MAPQKVHIRRTCGASGRMLMAGETYKVVERPDDKDQISIRDAKTLVGNQKARWVVPDVAEQAPDAPQDRTRPDVDVQSKKSPETRKRRRTKKKD